jgi:hypothetical protein
MDLIMSLLSKFVSNHLVPSLESAFLSHEKDAQDIFLHEMNVLVTEIAAWVASKYINNSDEK